MTHHGCFGAATVDFDADNVDSCTTITMLAPQYQLRHSEVCLDTATPVFDTAEYILTQRGLF